MTNFFFYTRGESSSSQGTGKPLPPWTLGSPEEMSTVRVCWNGEGAGIGGRGGAVPCQKNICTTMVGIPPILILTNIFSFLFPHHFYRPCSAAAVDPVPPGKLSPNNFGRAGPLTTSTHPPEKSPVGGGGAAPQPMHEVGTTPLTNSPRHAARRSASAAGNASGLGRTQNDGVRGYCLFVYFWPNTVTFESWKLLAIKCFEFVDALWKRYFAIMQTICLCKHVAFHNVFVRKSSSQTGAGNIHVPPNHRKLTSIAHSSENCIESKNHYFFWRAVPHGKLWQTITMKYPQFPQIKGKDLQHIFSGKLLSQNLLS